MSERLPDDFSDRLVANEEVDPMRLQNLRDQVTAVLEMKLSKPLRWWNAIGGVLMIALTIGIGILAATRWADQPFLARVVTIVGLAGIGVMGTIMITVARRGVYDRRSHNSMYIGLSFLMCIGLGMALLHTGWSSNDGQMVFGGTVLLVFGGSTFVLHVLEQYHLATRQKLLELQVQMAELAERLDRIARDK